MNFSYFHSKSEIVPRKLLEFGFVKEDDCVFVLQKELPDSDFYVYVRITQNEVVAKVYENETNEIYALVDVPAANGAFVCEIRQKVQNLMEEILFRCFETTDIFQKYIDFIKVEFGAKREFPWEDESSVFRCPNEKWFALLMQIGFKKLGIESDELVWVVNLKADADKISELVNHKTIFPAWHMNKKYWITVILTAVTDFEQLCSLTIRSFELAGGKKNSFES